MAELERQRVREPAAPNGRRRFRIAIVTALTLGFGGLVMVAAASVLGIGLWSARENTVALMRERAELSVDLLVERVRGHLDPVMKANAALARMIADGEVDPEDTAQLGHYMKVAAAATPQVAAMVYLRTDLRMTRYQRDTDQVTVIQGTPQRNPRLGVRLEIARRLAQPFWGDLVWVANLKATLLTRRAPIHRNGKFIGLLASAVSLADLSRFLRDADDRELGERSFLLYGDNHVLAHPALAAGTVARSRREPVPALERIGDPVLANLWNRKLRRPGIWREAETRGHLLDLPDDTYAVAYRQLDGYAALPLLAGRYAALGHGGLGREFERLLLAGGVGLAVLVASVLAALWFGRRIARPIRALARAAEEVRALELDPPPLLRRSPLIELDEAANAFNSMIAGLRWFETYVPRGLVRVLLANDGEAEFASAEREVTVLFTDIRSFTSLAETMSAAETADFLNAHFSLIAACVEREDGTIDKYIGDSVMAFWGAPRPTADHAIRACRAALAIREAIGRDNADRRARGESALRMGIGIHTGRVIAGNIGAPGRINYTLVGDSVNLAQRLEEMSKTLAGDADGDVVIMISAAVAERVDGEIAVTPCGVQPIRGRGAGADIYRLT